ncbi:hypothetical protein V8C34DRAFT_107754 [Trichoderma compactum]
MGTNIMAIHLATFLSLNTFPVRKSILASLVYHKPLNCRGVTTQRPLCDLLFGVFVRKMNESMGLFHKSRLQEKYAEYARKLSGQPTERDVATHFARDGEATDSSFEAVVLVIYFSSVTYTRDDQAFYSFGYSRETLWLSLKKATRAALLRAQ